MNNHYKRMAECVNRNKWFKKLRDDTSSSQWSTKRSLTTRAPHKLLSSPTDAWAPRPKPPPQTGSASVKSAHSTTVATWTAPRSLAQRPKGLLRSCSFSTSSYTIQATWTSTRQNLVPPKTLETWPMPHNFCRIAPRGGDKMLHPRLSLERSTARWETRKSCKFSKIKS